MSVLVDISTISADPKQPRKYFDDAEIAEMAANIKEVGIINPIEIDKKGFIVTGERRFRAAKKAGLKQVPVSVIEPKDEQERFFRQVSENIHHNTMSPWETAKALDRLLKEDFIGAKKAHATSNDKGISRLSQKLGINPVNARRLLTLLEERKDVQDALREQRVTHTLVFEIRSAPIEFQNELRDRMLKGEFDKASKSGVRMLARALRTQPGAAKKILAGNYTNLSGDAMKSEILRRAPLYTDTPIAQQIRDNLKGYQQLLDACNLLGKVLDSNPPASIPDVRKKQSVMQVVGMMGTLKKWFELLPPEFHDKVKKLAVGDK